MAIVTKTTTNYYKAHWTALDGTQRSKMTTHREITRALKQANNYEAEDQFHSQMSARVFDFMAANGLSPDGCYDHFTHKSHMKRDVFKQLCRKLGVKFKAPKDWIDKKKKTGSRAKKYRWNSRLLTLEEILRGEQSPLSINTVQARLKNNIPLKDAVSTPVKSKKNELK